VLGGAARFSTSSSMDDPDNYKYKDLQQAIDLLLYAGDIDSADNPTVARRANFFSTQESDDINAMLMYLLMVQIGKYTYYYGNSSAGGIKGAGTQANKCFTMYTGINITYNIGAGDVGGGTLLDFLGLSQTGSCDSVTNGHSKLIAPTANATIAKRLCQGVVLLNNFLDVFPEVVDNVSSTDLDVLKNLKAQILKVTSYVKAPDISTVKTVQSQAKCEAENATPFDNLQVYFVFYYEMLFQ
ncbi:MAG: hypothetical protein WCG27_02105, partial [Pseudomonadota bacterium]